MFGGSAISFNALPIFSFNFSDFSMTISPNFVFVKNNYHQTVADGLGGILGTGPKKFCFGVVCCGGKEG